MGRCICSSRYAGYRQCAESLSIAHDTNESKSNRKEKDAHMEWTALYGPDRQPGEAEISAYIANPLWEDINEFLKTGYGVNPEYSYSSCSGQPGWNVKYKKAGRSLCTLYPMAGFYIALVTIGTKEQSETELAMPMCTPYIQQLFAATPYSAMGRWLMIHVTDEDILEDVKQLIQIRRKK